jgi:cold shock CspA family protein
MIGTIKFVARNADYAFIAGTDRVEYFLHVRDTPNKIIPPVGAEVSFMISKGKDGRLRAVNATPIDPTPVESWRTDL